MKNDILDKIKKLLALANSSNEHEAKVASARAQELLVKYNLTMQDVDNVSHKYTEEMVETGRKRAATEWKYIQSLLREFFFIEIVHTKKPIYTGDIAQDMFGPQGYKFCYVMFGQPHNIEVAKYVRDFLTHAFKNSFKAYRKEHNAPAGSRQSYYYGLYQGLHEQLTQARQGVEQETGLVVVPDADLEKHINDVLSGALTKSQSRATLNDKQAAMAGYEQGKEMRIAKGLGGGSENKQIGETLRLGSGT